MRARVSWTSGWSRIAQLPAGERHEDVLQRGMVGGEEDGAARAAKAADPVPQLAARLRVEARGGLVEEQELRPGDECARHREALLLAARELAHPRGALLLEPHQAEHFLYGV